jgi:hypothetical protein
VWVELDGILRNTLLPCNEDSINHVHVRPLPACANSPKGALFHRIAGRDEPDPPLAGHGSSASGSRVTEAQQVDIEMR